MKDLISSELIGTYNGFNGDGKKPPRLMPAGVPGRARNRQVKVFVPGFRGAKGLEAMESSRILRVR